jgi:ribosomal protein S18 acetylase RimI-like enzyme
MEFSFEYVGRGGFIDELCAFPEDRGKGIGPLAPELIERTALGARVIAHLEVSRDDFAALKLYPRAVITTGIS